LKPLPFHPLIDLLKRAFSIQATDSDDVIRERIDAATSHSVSRSDRQ
jgi:hypothetical protein